MPWYSRIPGASIFTHDIDLTPIWRAVGDHPEMVMLAVGIFFRLEVYGHGRPYWMDEGSLAGNVVDKRPLDFSEPLTGDQLAPFGFLIVVRAVVSILGRSPYVTRLLPLVCGILALVAFTVLARRILPRRAALVAIALFAFSDDLIYYSSEFKPYSLDLAVGVAITLVAYDALTKPASWQRARNDSLESPQPKTKLWQGLPTLPLGQPQVSGPEPRRETFGPADGGDPSGARDPRRTAACIALCAILAPWCSFTSTFMVAGCGSSLVLAAFLARRYRDALVWGAIGVGWLLSFLLAYTASQSLLSPYTTMYIFWDFAFLPLWPRPSSPVSLVKAGGILLDVFVNPLNLVPPACRWLGAVLPLSLLVGGAVRLFRRSWSVWLMLVLPVALAVIASVMKRYPLHGRLILELVPAFFLLIAEGTQAVFELDRGRRKLVSKAVLVVLLAYPCFSAVYEATATRPRYFNSHGDLHNNLFLFEQTGRPPRPVRASE
jgi:hypothetical protein